MNVTILNPTKPVKAFIKKVAKSANPKDMVAYRDTAITTALAGMRLIAGTDDIDGSDTTLIEKVGKIIAAVSADMEVDYGEERPAIAKRIVAAGLCTIADDLEAYETLITVMGDLNETANNEIDMSANVPAPIQDKPKPQAKSGGVATTTPATKYDTPLPSAAIEVDGVQIQPTTGDVMCAQIRAAVREYMKIKAPAAYAKYRKIKYPGGDGTATFATRKEAYAFLLGEYARVAYRFPEE